MGLPEPYGLEVERCLGLDTELLVDGRGEVRALPVLTVTDDDLVGLGLQGADVPHELLAVGVSGESVHGLPLHVDLEGDGLALHVQGDLGPSPLDGPSDASLGLVSDEQEPVVLVVAHSRKYSMTGPPDIIPLVASTMQGSGE